MSPRHVAVSVPVPIRDSFCYRCDQKAVPTGALVKVTFGRRKLVGVVLGETEPPPDIPAANIREIDAVVAHPHSVPDEVMQLCMWAADYYHHPLGEVFATALPTLIRAGNYQYEPPQSLCLTAAGQEVDPNTLTRAPVQRKALLALADGPLPKDVTSQLGISTQTIRTLIDKSWVHWQTKTSEAQAPTVTAPELTPTLEQNTAIEEILKRNGTYLLNGITGSGKTEVYLQVIEAKVMRDQQVLVLVPEIGLTPQTIARFERRFNMPIHVYHSSTTDRERADTWTLAEKGDAKIVLGTRSAVFLPFKHLGAIVVDEEHDPSYKQQDGLRYSARDIAVLRGQQNNVPVVLGSATPSLESLHNCSRGKYQELRLTERPPGVQSETYELIDTRHLEKVDGFTRRLKSRIRETLEAGNQVLVFLNRRGYAPVLICNDCGWIANCRSCDAKLTYHLSNRSLICHHCGNMSHNILSCQSCGSRQVAAIGIGTERVEETLAKLYPDFPVIRVDRDSTRRKGELAAMIDRVNSGLPAILVGTQLLAKGHHFPAVTLAAILDVDGGFYSTDFRATERVGQLIVQVGGRAGREDRSGQVLIQTEFAGHPLLKSLVESGYDAFAQRLIEEREAAELPPFVFQALIRAEAKESRRAREFLEQIADQSIKEDSFSLLGPVPAIMEKRSGRYRQLLIVTSTTRNALHQAIRHLIDAAAEAQDARTRWSIDIDPTDLF